jgi:hypothetical protein
LKIKCSTFGKEEREKQNRLRAKVYLIGPFCFATQDIIEGVSGFRIDSRTIKRGNLDANTVI